MSFPPKSNGFRVKAIKPFSISMLGPSLSSDDKLGPKMMGEMYESAHISFISRNIA